MRIQGYEGLAAVRVDPNNVRAGAVKVDGARGDVMKIPLPAFGSAAAGLSGFATADVLSAASDAQRSSLTVAAGRFDEMQQLLRQSADRYEHQDQANAVPLTLVVGTGMTSLGDLNGAS